MTKWLVALFAILFGQQVWAAEPRWMLLPDMPQLPPAKASGHATVNGAKLWYATFGAGEPVMLLHGGLANANYWGHQVRFLMKTHRVIVMDSRGHGRSGKDGKPVGYDLMADDVIGVLDLLKVQKTAIVGWSDGAILGLDIAMRHPERLTKLFAFAANYDPSGVADISSSKVFTAYMDRAGKEYEKLSPTPKGYGDFRAAIEKMWDSQPNWTAEQLGKIKTFTWIVDGDHDEAIKRPHTEDMAAMIPNAGLLIQPWASHFAFLQAPSEFNADLARFLAAKP